MMINTHNHNPTRDFSQEVQRCRNYIQALEEERRKIQVFQRELPLSLQLVQQAIESCKQQLSGTTVEYNLRGQSECSDQTSSDVPVFEEFIPIKRPASSHSSDGEEHESEKEIVYDDDDNDDGKTADNDKNSKKSDWLRSVQLWNQTPDPSLKEDSIKEVEVTRNGSNGAFHPFKKDNNNKSVENSGAVVPPASASSTVETGDGGNKKDEKDGQSHRKARRCWSPELHRRFLQALEQLGGSHASTPKQIRELMKVDGLTNDEVKSHLQKYRLHTRRPSPTIPTTTATQTQQFVVVGGIWVPPEYATMATTTATSGEGASNGIYAPIATLPPHFQHASTKQRQHKPLLSDGGVSHIDGAGVRSNSPATSSSTHITASSPES